MLGKKGNSLVLIENGRLTAYALDKRLVWEVGRPSKGNIPDIVLHSTTVSREHGRFQNIDGVWFYIDKKGKNGTVYNGKHVTPGLRGRIKPITLSNGDILIFGGGEEAVIDSRTIWALFCEKSFDEQWRIEYTADLKCLTFSGGERSTVLKEPAKGTVVENDDGIAIYMGDITYLIGNIALTGK